MPVLRKTRSPRCSGPVYNRSTRARVRSSCACARVRRTHRVTMKPQDDSSPCWPRSCVLAAPAALAATATHTGGASATATTAEAKAAAAPRRRELRSAPSAQPPAAAPTPGAAARAGALARRARAARSATLQRSNAASRASPLAARGPLDRRVPASTLRAIAACESHGNPRAIGGGGAYRGMFQMTFHIWAAVGGHGDPAAASVAEQYLPRRARLRALRLGPVARLRPLRRAADPPEAAGAVTVSRRGPRRLPRRVPGLRDPAYLNAGTCGPLPRAAATLRCSAIAAPRWPRAAPRATTSANGDPRRGCGRLRGRRSAPTRRRGGHHLDDRGAHRVLLGLDLKAGDEVLTAEHEHPGLLGPLIARARPARRDRPRGPARRDRRGGRSRHAAGRVLAVAWTTGEVARRLGGLPDDAGAARRRPGRRRGRPSTSPRWAAHFYAGSGQKWMCGPVGTGMLWVAPAWRERLTAAARRLHEPRGPAAGPATRVCRRPTAAPTTRWRCRWRPPPPRWRPPASLAAFGWPQVHARARDAGGRGGAARWPTPAARSRPAGTRRSSRGARDDPEAEAARLLEAGVVVRASPACRALRASVGAWNDESDVSGWSPPRQRTSCAGRWPRRSGRCRDASRRPGTTRCAR